MYGVEILLTRALYPFIISVYIPSTLLVMLSWVYFVLIEYIFRNFLLIDIFLPTTRYAKTFPASFHHPRAHQYAQHCQVKQIHHHVSHNIILF